MKIYTHLLAFFIGLIVSYNLLIHHLDYRISFYGFKQVEGNVVPVAKIRRVVKGDGKMNFYDRGREIEMFTVPLENTTFTDEEVSRMYCKEFMETHR